MKFVIRRPIGWDQVEAIKAALSAGSYTDRSAIAFLLTLVPPAMYLERVEGQHRHWVRDLTKAMHFDEKATAARFLTYDSEVAKVL